MLHSNPPQAENLAGEILSYALRFPFGRRTSKHTLLCSRGFAEIVPPYDATEATSIELSGESITITHGGTYLLTGSIEDGMITVNVSDSEKVQLVLCGVEISNSSNASVYIKEADNRGKDRKEPRMGRTD